MPAQAKPAQQMSRDAEVDFLPPHGSTPSLRQGETSSARCKQAVDEILCRTSKSGFWHLLFAAHSISQMERITRRYANEVAPKVSIAVTHSPRTWFAKSASRMSPSKGPEGGREVFRRVPIWNS